MSSEVAIDLTRLLLSARSCGPANGRPETDQIAQATSLFRRCKQTCADQAPKANSAANSPVASLAAAAAASRKSALPQEMDRYVACVDIFPNTEMRLLFECGWIRSLAPSACGICTASERQYRVECFYYVEKLLNGLNCFARYPILAVSAVAHHLLETMSHEVEGIEWIHCL